MLAGPSHGDSPTSRPTRDASTSGNPRQFMLSYDRLAGSDPEDYLRLYQVEPGTDDLKLAQAQSRFDAQVGMLQKIVTLRFGEDAANQAIHAFGFQNVEDIRTAKSAKTEDRAIITYYDGSPGPQLIKINGSWRLDTSAFRQSLGMPVDAYIKQLHPIALIVADIADAIDRQQLTTADAVAHEIARRTAVLYQ